MLKCSAAHYKPRSFQTVTAVYIQDCSWKKIDLWNVLKLQVVSSIEKLNSIPFYITLEPALLIYQTAFNIDPSVPGILDSISIL